MPYTYTHITASPLYTSTHHTIERLSRSSWQITSPLLPAAIPAKSYAEAKAMAAEIDFSALSAKAADPAPLATVEVVTAEAMAQTEAMVNPFEVILAEASQITDLGTMQPAYDQAVRECDLCAVLGHLQGRGGLIDRCREAVSLAREGVDDYARVVELAGLISDAPLLTRINAEVVALYFDQARNPSSLIMALCDLPDGWLKTALIRWACADQYAGTWVDRLRLEGAALRYARERAHVGVAQEVRKVEDGGLADMGGDMAREWGEVWSQASDDVDAYRYEDDWDDEDCATARLWAVKARLPNLLSPEPEHWIPLQDGRVLIVNWRAGSLGEVISAAVWMDDGGLSLMGSYVLGSGWVSDDRLREEDVDGEALGVILEAIARAGLATIA